MNQLPCQISLPSSISTGLRVPEAKAATPAQARQSLFHKLIQGLGRESFSKKPGTVNVPCIGTRASNNADQEEHAKKALSNLLSRLEDSGIPVGGLRLPGSAAPVVAGLLEEKGFSSPEIDQVLKSIKDEEGLLMLDKLMARLGVEGIKKKDSLSGLSISRSDIPRVQEMLVKMELGPSEVKEAVEKSTDRSGDLSLDRLTGALRGHFQDIGPDTAQRLANLLEKEMGVQVRRDSLEKILAKAGLEDPGVRLSRAVQEGAGYEIKKEIADLLRKKDIQPQEIKRFLESLEVKENITQGRGKASAESLTLLQRQEQNAPSEGWKARILEILHKEGLNGPSVKQGPEVENGSLKNRTAEILEKVIGDEKGRAQQQPSERDLLTALRARAGDTTADKGRAPTPTDSGVEGRIGTEEASRGKPAHWGESYVQRAERTVSVEPGPRPGASASTLPEPLPKIVDRLAWMVKAGEQHARVHVSPPDLGRLDLDLVIKNGHLHAHLSAENHAVKELLEANLQQLRQQLNGLGFVVERFELDVGLKERRGAEAEEWTWGKGRRGGRAGRLSPGGDVELPAVEPPRMGLHGPYQVDLEA